MALFPDHLARFGPDVPFRPISLSFARDYCQSVTKQNAENFTVASWLLPKALRPHFHAVYAYCRWSDDLADETGDRASELLKWWRGELNNCFDGVVRHPVFVALHETNIEFAIPKSPFADLLTAFEQDQIQKSYSTFDDLLSYCRNSANPVGRIILYLFRCHDDERGRLADEICTGLQLANFWQDVARDQAIGRRYLPDEDLARFEYSVADWNARCFTPAFAELLRFEVDRTQGYFDRGRALLTQVPRSLRVDLSLFIQGGEAILSAIRDQDFDVWSHRPVISKWRKAGLLLRALAGI